MDRLQIANGQCLCGKVKFQAKLQKHLDACHCQMCQRWGGGPLLVAHACEIRFEGGEAINNYASSEWAQRGLCRHCGSHLYYQLLNGEGYEVPVGLFEEGVAFDFRKEIFIDRKPVWYEFANGTEKLTEAEVLAQFAGQ